jgi:hypothetical protein
MLTVSQVVGKVRDLESTYAERDRRHSNVREVRAGNLSSVFPELFGSVTERNYVANFIDVVSRDLAEMIAPLPALNCVSGTITSDRARKFAGKRQRIGTYYWQASNLKLQMAVAADQYLTYGFVALQVEPNFEDSQPRLKFIDPWGSYPEFDANGNCCSFTRKTKIRSQKLAHLYPEHARNLVKQNPYGDTQDKELTVYRYVDCHQTIVFVHERDNLILEQYENRLSECPVVVAVRPSHDGEMRGQFDDVLGVQAAKSFLAGLSLEAAERQVQAPIAIPDDVAEIPIGGNALLRSATPEKIGVVDLKIGNGALLEGQKLENELRMGTRYPQGRSGEMEGSIVTGKGVQALLGTFDTQIKTAQSVFSELLRKATRLAYKLDETYWPSKQKTIRGVSEGTPFEDKYTPKRDIDGDYTCDITYGMMAGMDPSRGLVFILQALGAGIVDKQTAMRQMPWEIDSTALAQNIEVERMREAGLAGLLATAQAIAPIITQGGDAGVILTALAAAIKDRQAGKPIEEALLRFAPQPPPEGTGDAQAGEQAPPGQEGPGGMSPPGMQASGLLQGVAPGQAGMPPGGKPALQDLLAGLSGNGQPNLRAGVRRMVPTQ